MQIFTKFQPEKYDFDLHKEFFMEKIDLNLLDLVVFFFFKSTNFYDKFK
jgi:hypothetical protein